MSNCFYISGRNGISSSRSSVKPPLEPPPPQLVKASNIAPAADAYEAIQMAKALNGRLLISEGANLVVQK